MKRSEGRRRLRRLLWVLAAVAVLAAAGASTRTALLDVDRITVDGTTSLAVDDVLATAADAGVGRGTPLVDVDAGALERALESLPAVADASVARRWPGTVEIDLVERTPVAVVTSGDVAGTVAADGVIVAVGPVAAVGLPRLDATLEDVEPGAVVDAPELLEVAASLPASVASRVDAVGPSAHEGEVELRLVDGGIVRLGPPADVGAKLVAVATMLEQIDLACLATLDVRVPLAPAVTRAAGCAP